MLRGQKELAALKFIDDLSAHLKDVREPQKNLPIAVTGGVRGPIGTRAQPGPPGARRRDPGVAARPRGPGAGGRVGRHEGLGRAGEPLDR